MKKILQSAVLFFGVCFFAGKANAQLASDTPAMTTEQAAKLMKERMATIPVRAADSVTISKTTTKTIAVKKRPAISDQDVVNPVLVSETTKPVLTTEATNPASAQPNPVKVPEVKLPVAPVQEKKVKDKE